MCDTDAYNPLLCCKAQWLDLYYSARHKMNVWKGLYTDGKIVFISLPTQKRAYTSDSTIFV